MPETRKEHALATFSNILNTGLQPSLERSTQKRCRHNSCLYKIKCRRKPELLDANTYRVLIVMNGNGSKGLQLNC